MEISRILKTKSALLISALLCIAAAKDRPNAIPRTTERTLVQTEDTTKVENQTDTTALEVPIIKGKDAGRHKATWYQTKGHIKVHRDYPTAAYNLAPIGTKLLVKNLLNSKSCTVVVTDRMAKDKRKLIDLSHMAFGIIAEHGWGTVPVQITILD